jgi:predicted RNA binding protein YcfA (HicA-like mRNA interferase family)
MSTRKISNVKISDFRHFLEKCGCRNIGTEGGHEKWAREDLTRPVIVQTHIEPVPEFVVRNALRNLGLAKDDYFRIMEAH